MALAILDEKFELHRRLSDNPMNPVYLATDPRGNRKVVRFVQGSERFFEELARYYACDGLDGVCRLGTNYPPFSVNGSKTLLQKDIAEMLDWGDEWRTPRQEGPSNEVGALVFDYVPGLNLDEVLVEDEPSQALSRLSRLASTLAAMHKRGEYHGRLLSDHVLVDLSHGDVVLIGLGGSQELAYKAGCAQDVHLFAKHFLSKVDHGVAQLDRLTRACLKDRAASRPTMHRLARVLHDTVHQLERPWYAKPVLPLAATALLLLSLHLFYQPLPQITGTSATTESGLLENVPMFLDEFSFRLQGKIKAVITYPHDMGQITIPAGAPGEDWRDRLKKANISCREVQEDQKLFLYLEMAEPAEVPKT